MSKIMRGVAVIYFLFYALWGLNYYRLPLNKSLKLPEGYTTEELMAYVEKTIEQSNKTHLLLVDNDTLKVPLLYSKKEILSRVSAGYKNISGKIPEFNYHPTSLKASLYSLALSYMGYSGYFNPFSGEAQVNTRVLTSQFPITACHEVAHQIGYSAENEANFIGYLAAVNNDDAYFRYAAHTFALEYALFELKKRDPLSYKALYEKIHRGILERYKADSQMWKAYENFSEPFFKETYDAYLKANKQAHGINSYDYVVDLLINYSKKGQESPEAILN